MKKERRKGRRWTSWTSSLPPFLLGKGLLTRSQNSITTLQPWVISKRGAVNVEASRRGSRTVVESNVEEEGRGGEGALSSADVDVKVVDSSEVVGGQSPVEQY